jgi:sucrose phosphorylase
MNCLDKMFSDRFLHYLVRLYGKEHARQHLLRLQTVLGRYEMDSQNSPADSSKWSEKDTVLITYGDMVRQETRMPLATLHQFCQQHLREAVNTVHILPFFPYSSDDGFSVVDYREVDPNLGSWQDIDRFAGDFRLMFDLVLNHVSRRSAWFRDYTSGILPAQHYFIEVAAGTDLSKVVRPRSLPLLTRTHTRDGARLVWTTFSDDQIDLNFANPDVLFEFIDILLTYIEHGAGLIRMDAIAYLWKEIGTNCIHLPQTHQVVKLFRDILDIVSPRSLLITETNVPHAENISYFGNGDEADMVYQFSLPPLLLHALLNGNAQYVREWAKTVSARRTDLDKTQCRWFRKPVRAEHHLLRCPVIALGARRPADSALPLFTNRADFTARHTRHLFQQSIWQSQLSRGSRRNRPCPNH